MKKIFMSTLLMAGAMSAQADGYVGASLGRGKLPFDCAQDATCKQSVNVFKIYAGTRLKEASQLRLGPVQVDALEVGFVKTGSKASETSIVEQSYIIIDPINGNTVTTRMVPQIRQVSLDALVFTPVLHMPLSKEFDVFVKPGAALITATMKTTLNGVSQRSESELKLKPYVSFGASYAVTPGVRVFGSSDWFPYSVEGVHGVSRALNLGAEVSF